jgi:hypothetical protein
MGKKQQGLAALMAVAARLQESLGGLRSLKDASEELEAAFDEVRLALNRVTFEMLDRHFYEVQVHLDSKQAQAWNDHKAVLEVIVDAVVIRLPVPVLRAQMPDLAKKVQRRLNVKTYKNAELDDKDGRLFFLFNRMVDQFVKMPAAEWFEIHSTTVRELVADGGTVLAKYVQSGTFPNGCSYTDIGWCLVHGEDVASTPTWNHYAVPLTRAIFGSGGHGYYAFFCPVGTPVPGIEEKVEELRSAESLRWVAKQAEGFVKVYTCGCDTSSNANLFVDGKRVCTIYRHAEFGFPVSTWGQPSEIVEITREKLETWLRAALAAYPDRYVRGDSWGDSLQEYLATF